MSGFVLLSGTILNRAAPVLSETVPLCAQSGGKLALLTHLPPAELGLACPTGTPGRGGLAFLFPAETDN